LLENATSGTKTEKQKTKKQKKQKNGVLSAPPRGGPGLVIMYKETELMK
jgi:hypothetical protein